ncbi:MAG: hypothetical protein ACRC33_02435 [Gemmataceae bacterium]
MLFFLQVVLAAAGVGILVSGRLPLGGREVRGPIASLIGGILAAALPLTVLLLALYAAPEMARHSNVGLDKAYRQASAAYWWIRPLMMLLTVGTAGGLAYLALCTEQGPLPLSDGPFAPSEALEKVGEIVGHADGIVSAAPAWASPAEPDELPPVVARYHAPGKGIPPEVEALGRAEKLFKPSTAGSLAAWWEGKAAPTVLVFRQALVTVTGDDFVILPWNAVASITGRTLTAADGQAVELSPFVEDASRLEVIARQRVGERLQADVEARLAAGEEVSFGALAATDEELRCGDRSVPWFEIGHVRVHEFRSLHVTRGGSPLPWCMVPREKIANEFLLMGLIAKKAPGSVQMV